MSDELSDDIHAQITLLAEQANEFAEAERHDDALRCFERAWELLPEPRNRWTTATWRLTSMGDGLFFQGRFGDALAALQEAVSCPRYSPRMIRMMSFRPHASPRWRFS
jgi:tetratricopeptide (TPR) repeat protein